MDGTQTQSRGRLVGGAVALVAIAVAIFLLVTDSSYVVHARFQDAGQLVDGAVVEVAGHQVGKVGEITLTDDGVANVPLVISTGAYTPLPAGTRASIRAVGQAGLNNRYVSLTPSPTGGGPIPNGGTLDLSNTSGIVDLDALLNTFDPDMRASVQALLAESGDMFAGSRARSFNRMLAQAAPGLDQVAELSAELNADDARLSRLIATSSETAQALNERPAQIRAAIVTTARAFQAVNTERAALDDALGRLPAVLEDTTRTFAHVRETIPPLQEDLRLVPAAGRPLTNILRNLDPAAERLRPLLVDTEDLLPDLNKTLAGLPPLEHVARPALKQTGWGLNRAIPLLAALRVYTPDLILGVFGGLGGIASASYDGLGHYGRLLIAASPQASTSGFARTFGLPEFPGFKLRTGVTAPCPGSAAEPAPDKSNVWVPDPELCDPSQRHP